LEVHVKITNATQTQSSAVQNHPAKKVKTSTDPLDALLTVRPARRDAFRGDGADAPPKGSSSNHPTALATAQNTVAELTAQGAPKRSDYPAGASGTAEYNQGSADYARTLKQASSRVQYEQLSVFPPQRQNYPDQATYDRDRHTWNEQLSQLAQQAGLAAPISKSGD
jgi:hypothetical protein